MLSFFGGGILAVLGYKHADQLIYVQVDKYTSFYTDLSAGLTYMDKYPESAIPYLMLRIAPTADSKNRLRKRERATQAKGK